MTTTIPNSPAATNSTKWSNRLFDFGYGAFSVGSVVAPVALGVVAGAGVFASSGVFVVAAAVMVATSAALIVSAVAMSVSGVSAPRVASSPTARKLGMVFSTLSALTAGGYAPYALHTYPFSPATPVSQASTTAFKVTAKDCDAASAVGQLQTIREKGFKATCTPAP